MTQLPCFAPGVAVISNHAGLQHNYKHIYAGLISTLCNFSAAFANIDIAFLGDWLLNTDPLQPTCTHMTCMAEYAHLPRSDT